MSKYYQPNISEFIEGFKYQVKETYGYSIIDFSNPENSTKPDMKDYWVDRAMPNMDPIEYPYSFTDEEGIKWTIMNEPFPKEDPLRTIKIMLENGNIRAKK